MDEHLSPLTRLSVPRTGTLSVQETGNDPEFPSENDSESGRSPEGRTQIELLKREVHNRSANNRWYPMRDSDSRQPWFVARCSVH